MQKKHLEIGKIVGTHGVKGEVRVQPWCDTPDFLTGFKNLYFDNEGRKEISVNSARVHGNLVLLVLDGVSTVEQASALREKILYMDRDDVELEDGDFFIQDLIDCTVVDADNGCEYGILSDVSSTGANDVWHITDKLGKEYLIPAIPSVVIETDTVKGTIKIRPMRGIFEDED